MDEWKNQRSWRVDKKKPRQCRLPEAKVLSSRSKLGRSEGCKEGFYLGIDDEEGSKPTGVAKVLEAHQQSGETEYRVLFRGPTGAETGGTDSKRHG